MYAFVICVQTYNTTTYIIILYVALNKLVPLDSENVIE